MPGLGLLLRMGLEVPLGPGLGLRVTVRLLRMP